MSRPTLAQQLAQLEDPTPIDVDPENAYDISKDQTDDQELEFEDTNAMNREHYIDAGPSSMRKLHDSLNDPKYAGRKITRTLGEVPESSESDDGHSEPVEHEPHGLNSSEASEEHEEETEETSEEEEERPVAKPRTVKEERRATEDVSSSLKRMRDADRLKGQAVTRQMAIWDSILDARIRLQKSVALCNTLPLPSSMPPFFNDDACKTSVEAFVKESLLLSEDLFDLEETFLSDLDDLAMPPRKRRKLEFDPSASIADLDTEVLASSTDLSALQATYHPYLLQTLHKWSAKIQAVTPQALLSSRNRFSTASKAKSTVDLIQETLADHAKVVGRTRTLRSTTSKRIVVQGEGVTIGGDFDVEGKIIECEDVEVFDDTDFYQQLLRDVIDGRSAGDGNSYGLDDSIPTKTKKPKKIVDTKASKGRKLRYEVHEKLQNFMVPIPLAANGGWHEEKIDELFASVMGRTLPRQAGVGEAEGEAAELMRKADAELRVGGFRLFG